MTTEQREALRACAAWHDEAEQSWTDAIRAALAELDRQAEELGLLRAAARHATDRVWCPTLQEWRRRFGGKLA